MKKITRKQKRQIKLAIILALIVLAIGSVIYVNDYYHASEAALACIEEPSQEVDVEIEEDKYIAFVPMKSMFGLIFYPGGKVEFEAYAPLMEACAKQGILCVLMDMPANLAVLDVNAAKGIQEKFLDVTQWYIGGHSLGGAMAAKYVEKHADEYEGLILLGAYSTKDLNRTELAVLSVLASEDEVLNQEKYDKNQKNLPNDYREVTIEGGCHSYFGSYGTQKGDGKPTISREAQLEITVEEIMEFIEWDLTGAKAPAE